MSKFVRYRSGEWSALYMDGDLVRSGDHYLVDDWLSEYLKVEEIYSDDFLHSDGRTIYRNLDGVQAATTAREERQAQAQRLRLEAAALVQQAEELEKKNA
jgi:hypothetical protein